MLTFVVPVRDPRTVLDWGSVRRRIDMTLRSISRQRGNWRCVVVATSGTDLPSVQGVEIAYADFPLVQLPATKKSPAYYDGVRLDKGRRVMFGLVHTQPTGHTMVVDFDDLVSCQLAEHCAENPDGHGWFCDTGYLFSEDRKVWPCPAHFHRICGSSLIINAGLLSIPRRFEDADPAYYATWMGSHKFSVPELDRLGTPLAPLPFSGAAYRVGHPDATSGSGQLEQMVGMIHQFHPGTRRVGPEAITAIGADFTAEFGG